MTKQRALFLYESFLEDREDYSIVSFTEWLQDFGFPKKKAQEILKKVFDN
jgi:hypothetical protein